jgi:hypothetical protein
MIDEKRFHSFLLSFNSDHLSLPASGPQQGSVASRPSCYRSIFPETFLTLCFSVIRINSYPLTYGMGIDSAIVSGDRSGEFWNGGSTVAQGVPSDL